MSFYQQSTISLYSWFLLVLSCNIFLMTFHGSIFLNIKLGPTTTSSPRRRGHGLHNPDSSHDQIWCFWLAEVRNFTNIMIEYAIKDTMKQFYEILKQIWKVLEKWPRASHPDWSDPECWFNIKMSCYQYRNCNCKNIMVSWPAHIRWCLCTESAPLEA